MQNSFNNNVVVIWADTCNNVHVWSMAQPRDTDGAGLAKLFLTSRYNSHRLSVHFFARSVKVCIVIVGCVSMPQLSVSYKRKGAD